MGSESYLILWGWIENLFLSITKIYVFASLGKMLGEIRINKIIYALLVSMQFLILVSIRILGTQKKDYNIILLLVFGMVITWLIITVAYKSSVVQRWVVLVCWISAVCTSEGIVESLIYGIYYLTDLKDFWIMRVIHCVGIIITAMLIVMQLKIYTRLSRCIAIDKWTSVNVLIPLIVNTVLIVMMYYFLRFNTTYIATLVVPLMSINIGMLLSNIFAVISAEKQAIYYELEMERREITERSKAEYEYYSRLEAEQGRIRLLYHDINNHIACIKEVAKGQEKLTQYIDALEREVQMTTQTFNTGCSVVDAVLRQKSIVCENKNIRLDVYLSLNTCSFIEDKDLCTIFANVLDNAIEACDKIVSDNIERYIYMESKIVKGFLVIKIKNSKEHVNTWVNDVLVTQKKDKYLHGLGLTNIRRALEKYNSEYIVKEEENEFYLKLVIPLNAKKCN